MMTARHRLQAARHRIATRASGLTGTALLWLPALVGIGVMVGFTIYGLGLRVEEPAYEVPAEAGHTVGQEASPTPTPSAEPPAATLPPSEPPASTPPPTEPPPPPPPPPEPPPPATTEPPLDVVGEYRLKESFQDVFIGKVVIVNQSRQPQHWNLVLVFPDNVGKLLDFWVDGTAQPQLQVVDNRQYFTSTVPIDVESHIVLKVKFARSGADVDPEICEVNGSHCLI